MNTTSQFAPRPNLHLTLRDALEKYDEFTILGALWTHWAEPSFCSVDSIAQQTFSKLSFDECYKMMQMCFDLILITGPVTVEKDKIPVAGILAFCMFHKPDIYIALLQMSNNKPMFREALQLTVKTMQDLCIIA